MPPPTSRHRLRWLAVLGIAMGGVAYSGVRVILPVVRFPTRPIPTAYAVPPDFYRSGWWDLKPFERQPEDTIGPVRRNLFLYSTAGPGTPPLPPASPSPGTAPPVVTVRVNETPKPPETPPLPPSPLESLRLIGMIYETHGEAAYVILTDGREVWTLLPGQTFGTGVRVVRVETDAVLLETTDGAHQRRLVLPPRPPG